MIVLTRVNGKKITVNADLIERVESTPDTIVHLLDNTSWRVTESVQEVLDCVRDWRASILVRATDLTARSSERRADLRLLPSNGTST